MEDKDIKIDISLLEKQRATIIKQILETDSTFNYLIGDDEDGIGGVLNLLDAISDYYELSKQQGFNKAKITLIVGECGA